MRFQLEEYHRNTPDVELLADVKRVATILGKQTVTMDEYKADGSYHPSTL